jgi:hypothetical protein
MNNMKRIGLFLAMAMLAVAAVTYAMPHAMGGAVLGFTIIPALLRKSVQKSKAKKMINLDVEFISLVDEPANGLPIIMKDREGTGARAQIDFSIVKKDVTEGLIYATPYEPDTVDIQKDFTSAEEIQKAAHGFMAKSRQGNVDVQHNMQKGAGTVVESFILNGEDARFPNIKKGAWCVVIKLADATKALIGSINGVSIYGKCNYAKSASGDGEEVVQKGNGEWLSQLRADAKVGDIQMADILGLSLPDYITVEQGTNNYDFTPDVLKSIAKAVKQDIAVIAAAALTGNAPDPNAPADPNAPDPNATGGAGGGAPATGAMGKSVNSNDNSAKIMKEKGILSRGSVHVPGGHTVVSKSGATAAEDLEIRKSELFTKMASISEAAIVRKDLIGDGAFDIGGTVGVELSTTLLDLSMKESPLLSQIQVVQMDSLKQDVPLFSITGLRGTRLTTRGDQPDASLLVDTNNLTRTLSAADVDFPYNVTDSVLKNYRNRFAQFESMLGSSMLSTFRNDIVALGFYGTTDTFNGAALVPLYTCAVGWLAIGRAGATGDQAWRLVDYSAGGFSDITEAWDQAILNMATNSQKYANTDTAFIISAADYEAFESVLMIQPNGFDVMVNGAKGTYRGHPVIVDRNLAAGDWIYTPLKNLVMGIVTDGVNGVSTTTYQRLKSRDFLLTACVDYDIVDPLGFISGQA